MTNVAIAIQELRSKRDYHAEQVEILDRAINSLSDEHKSGPKNNEYANMRLNLAIIKLLKYTKKSLTYPEIQVALAAGGAKLSNQPGRELRNLRVTVTANEKKFWVQDKGEEQMIGLAEWKHWKT